MLFTAYLWRFRYKGICCNREYIMILFDTYSAIGGVNMPRQAKAIDTSNAKLISLRLPGELVDRIDDLATRGGFSRTSAVALILNAGIGLVEVLMNPVQMLNDPMAAEYIGRAM